MKRVLLIAMAMLMVLSAASCMQKIDTGSKNPSSQITGSEVSKPSVSSETSSQPQSKPESSIPDNSEESFVPEEGEVAIFDPETDTTVSEVVDAEEDLDAALVKALNAALSFDGYEIKVNDVTLENGGLTIDLAEDSMPLVGVGSSGEAACLRSIAVTFLKNYPDAELIYFTVDGGIYSSGHIEFAPGEPYMDRSMMD
ncbi:MAG: GerMN domain-containing protein [Oscillospiraceae bacterium]|nr:GerMN domain-containing protein [Oscillospiraceae bacterium]